MFDGHGKNGHMVSKMVRNRLPSVLLALKEEQNQESNVCEEEANKWENACFTAFRLIDRELNLQVFDCSFSGSTGVVAITQVHLFLSFSATLKGLNGGSGLDR